MSFPFGHHHHHHNPPPPPAEVSEFHYHSPEPPQQPPYPHESHVTNHSHNEYNDHNNLGELGNKLTFKIYTKAGGDQFSLSIRDNKVVLSHSDSHDPTQHWIKDEKYSTKVKDADGYPSFSLVNKSTGQVLKHSISGQPVDLSEYKSDAILDTSILWTESHDLGDGFRSIRMINNTKLVMDAFHGDKDHGGVHDGTLVALYESWKGDNQNQQWKIYPHSL